MINANGIQDKVLAGLDEPHLSIISFGKIVLHAGTGGGKLLDHVPFSHELKAAKESNKR
jgi:hypothetical protein